MSKKINNENWQEKAPILAQMEKINPFAVPEGYFDTLSDRIHQRIAAETKTSANNRIIPMWTRYAAAACLTCILGITLYLNLRQNAPPKVNWNEIPEEEIVTYLELNIEDADAALIIDKLGEQGTPGLNTGASEQELETYINQNL
jgi:hypothetical protein